MPASSTWSPSVLEAIAQRASLRVRAGSAPHRFLGIWAVVVDDRIFVRSWNDAAAGWHRAWRADPRGAVLVGTRELAVRAVPVRSGPLRDRVSAAYLEKYWRPGSLAYARGMDTPDRRATTLELVPAAARVRAPEAPVGGGKKTPAVRRRSGGATARSPRGRRLP